MFGNAGEGTNIQGKTSILFFRESVDIIIFPTAISIDLMTMMHYNMGGLHIRRGFHRADKFRQIMQSA